MSYFFLLFLMEGSRFHILMTTLYPILIVMIRLFLLSFCLMLFINSTLFANSSVDTIRTNSLLYSGIEYTRGLILFGESPFFMSNEPAKGSVKYQGNLYDVPELQYDCRNDVLVARDRSGDMAIELLKEKIDQFNIDGHHFDKLKIQSRRGEFYEKVYSGKHTLYIQWQKKIISNRVDEKRYVLFRNVYLISSNDTIRINKVSEYFNLLRENGAKIKRYYKEQHLNFRKEPVLAMESLLKKAEAEGW